ncbi:hypothetical protein TMU01_10780 [Tenuibacillus multivorans]|nr:hypothetical protein TMU01_10780 [Tenuibacillus multivorans]
MIDNPIQSSFPSSRVFKVIQKHHGDEKAFEYLRRAREALFALNKNIGEDSVMIEIVNELGLDGKLMVNESNEEFAHDLLMEDFALTRKLGARGFPTIIMVNEDNKGVKLVGGRTLDDYVAGLTQVLGETPEPKKQPSLSELLRGENLLFAKEIEVMYDVEPFELAPFVKEQLTSGTYEVKGILGEKVFMSSFSKVYL